MLKFVPVPGPTQLRMASLFFLIAIFMIYYGSGVHFVYSADSIGYLKQAASLGSEAGFDRSAARSFGYPLFISPLLYFPAPALAIFIAQAALAIAAYVALHRQLSAALPATAPNLSSRLRAPGEAITLALIVTANYSALHVFAAWLLPEILFAVLGFLAVFAVSAFVRCAEYGGRLWLRAAATAAIATLPACVKPHWLFAAPAIVAIVSLRLAVASSSSGLRISRIALAAILPFACLSLVLLPERHLSATVDPQSSLFGPRTLFCNHLHMVDDAIAKPDRIVLHEVSSVHHILRKAIADLRESDERPWKHLGFNGDICTHNPNFAQLVADHHPSIGEQRSFYIGRYVDAVKVNPFPFIGKWVRQISLGFERSFQKFAYHLASPHSDELNPTFLTGTTRSGEAGPFGSKATMKQTVAGWTVLATLATTFTILTTLLIALTLATIVVTPFRVGRWTDARRKAFFAFVAIPLIAIFAHHALIAVVHTFDIWRYAFGMFFVNLAFIGAAGLFWYEEWSVFRQRVRAEVPTIAAAS